MSSFQTRILSAPPALLAMMACFAASPLARSRQARTRVETLRLKLCGC
jgi:hypothetical protein